MASLFAPSMDQPRISQVLPTVKCSSCNQPVALAELGEHVCTQPPPVPALPRSRVSPQHPHVNTTNPLPTRVASFGLPVAGPPPPRFATPPARPPQLPQPSPVVSPAMERPPINAGPERPSFPQNSGAQVQHSRNDTSSSFQRHAQAAFPGQGLPVSPWPAGGRERSISSLSGRSPISTTHSGMPYPGVKLPASAPGTLPIVPRPPIPTARADARAFSFVPQSEVGIDTKTGGEAGMAGVGRRGFAAAVRAAMFVSPAGYPLDRRPDPPRFLDIDAASRSTDTPPLSAGSGSSSHSPGPRSPGPQADLIPEPFSKARRTPSPTQRSAPPNLPHLPSPLKSPVDDIANGARLSPLDRLPFFGKYRNMFPGVSTNPSPSPDSDGNKSQVKPLSTSDSNKGTPNRPDDSPRLRNLSVSTVTTQTYNGVADRLRYDDSDSSSECGLPYANSSDDERSTVVTESNNQLTSILRSGSTTTARRVHFPKSSRSRAGSDSSTYSSASDASKGRSTAIALALGISLNKQGGSLGLGSRQRSGSTSSVDTRSIYSRVTSIGPMSGPLSKGNLEQTMETLMEEVVIGESVGESPQSHPRSISSASLSPGIQPHRSKTVQVPLENKPLKLPARAKTTNDHNKVLLEPPTTRKEKVRRARVCLRCERRIEDGRWIKVDTGGALCENCWKNMYLPKCRRCQLPIENQAVSSADGQLKGKYHKKCFNCHVCHKPFPDKSFYVYDGKPLCAYHYHEANESLCAAARCGQPIEGPCAVSHAGDKYHPEHMTCEYPGSMPCNERLKEYWEVDGRMLCEKHAARAGDEDDDEDWIQTSKAKKRITRFMNLGGNGGTDDVLSDLL